MDSKAEGVAGKAIDAGIEAIQSYLTEHGGELNEVIVMVHAETPEGKRAGLAAHPSNCNHDSYAKALAMVIEYGEVIGIGTAAVSFDDLAKAFEEVASDIRDDITRPSEN